MGVIMEKKICCAFGHRELYKNIEDELYQFLKKLITEQNVETLFDWGYQGGFTKAPLA